MLPPRIVSNHPCLTPTTVALIRSVRKGPGWRDESRVGVEDDDLAQVVAKTSSVQGIYRRSTALGRDYSTYRPDVRKGRGLGVRTCVGGDVRLVPESDSGADGARTRARRSAR